MPINLRLTAVSAAASQPLAAFLAEAANGGREMPRVLVAPVQGLESAGLDPYLGGDARSVLAGLELTGRAGELAQVPIRIPAGPDGAAVPGQLVRLLLVGLGDASDSAMRKAGAAVGRRAPAGAKVAIFAVCGQPDRAAAAFAEGLLLGAYRFAAAPAASAAAAPDGGPAWKVADPVEVSVLAQDLGRCQSALDRAAVLAGAVALARDLANTPSGRKTPDWLAQQAVAVGGGAGLATRVWDDAALAAEGFGGLLAVGAGSARPPRLVLLEYAPAGWQRHIVLVGKGVTFDSGGLSLKPNDSMPTMKTDMAGGAAVIAVMSALAALKAPVKVTGLVAAAENMPSGSALRPGDVIKHYDGRTVEVLNTDAEGRLVLADALGYARLVLEPDAIVDVATLTGAARIALGTRTGALYATQDRLAEELLAAAAGSGEAAWRMPLVEEYLDALDSPIADLANVARGGGTRAGSIDAAMFLREFTGDCPWAHLDIAGAARAAADDGEISKGATGYGVRLLLRWLSSPAVGR